MTVLAEAEEAVAGDRNDNYGHPADDLARTARMWSGLFGIDITAEQVAWAMVLLKASRQVHRPLRDNLVDAAGYLRCVELIQERSK